MVQVSLKKRLVGEHADRCGTVLLVNARDRYRIEIRPQYAGRRRGTFDFGQNLHRSGAVESSAQVAHRRRVADSALQFLLGNATARVRYLAPLAGNDTLQNIGHTDILV